VRGRTATAAPARVAAFFDLDGTLARSNVVVPFAHLVLAGRSPASRAATWLALAPAVLLCAAIDLVSRRLFNAAFYALYRWISPAMARRLAASCVEQTIVPRLFPAMLRRIESHRARGHAVVIVSGGTDFIVEAVAARLGADAFAATRLEERDGRFTGRIAGDALAGEVKAGAVRRIAAERGYDLTGSFGYADDGSDLPFLASVAHPAAVRPRRALRREAVRRGWEIIAP
jgi:HAD superfamily hydrolase (TIGR01490 family)